MHINFTVIVGWKPILYWLFGFFPE